jgi:hypothetical protein
MKRFSLRAALAEYFELFLTIAGVLLAMMVILSQLSRGQEETALLFLIWLQGFILWAVHRHGWLRRHALVREMRVILDDLVNDRLTVMLRTAELRTRSIAGTDRESETIGAVVESLSLEFESLRAWEKRLELLRI